MHTECVFFPVAILLSSSLLLSFVFLTERRAFEFGGFVLLPGLFPSVPRQLDSNSFISDRLTQVCRAGPNLVFSVTCSVRINA